MLTDARSHHTDELAERGEVSDDLLRLLQWHRGDPRLSAWEEGFLTRVVRWLQTDRGALPTRKQWKRLKQVLDKLEGEPIEMCEDEGAAA